MKKENGRKTSVSKKEIAKLKNKQFVCGDCGNVESKSDVVFGSKYTCTECGGTLIEQV